MSDSSKIICLEGYIENNKQLATDLINELQREKIIEGELSDSTLGGLGYAKESEISKAVQFPEETAFLSLNGVKVSLEPSVYYSGEINPEFVVICPKCNQNWFKDISVVDFYTENLTKEQLQSYDDFVTSIYAYDGKDQFLKCNHCNVESEISSYNYQGMITFSNLALEFYNWGDFKDSFISHVEKNLGHKVIIYSMSY